MSSKLKIVLLLLILMLGAGLRLWHLGSVPPSPDWDEAALAYNAYSLSHTARDEYGNFLPPILRSFNDYKPAVYAYLAIPFIQLFDMTTFAIRLPSAVMGMIAMLMTYLLTRELFVIRAPKEGKTRLYGEYIALVAAFSLAVSPWHIQFSRIAFETNVGLTINILVAFFFLKALRHHWLLVLSFLLAGINLSVYQSERVFTPLLVLALIIIFRKEVFKIPRKYILGAFIAGVISVLPIAIYFTNNQNAFLRIKGTSIFNNQAEVLKRTLPKLEDDKSNNNALGFLLDNRRVAYTNTIAEAYISHFDPNWLFMEGDNQRHHAPRMGLIYIIFLPFILVGIYQLIFGKFDIKTKSFIFSWFLLAPVPASITTGVPHAVRTLNFLPMYDIFIAIGIISFVFFVSHSKHSLVTKPVKYAIFCLSTVLFLFNFVYYLNQYFVQQNYYYAYDWQYGYEKMIPVVEKLKNNYEKVIVSDREPLDNTYIFFLFYLKYPPQTYQKMGSNTQGFDKYEFRKFDWSKEKTNKNVLFVGSDADFYDNIVTDHIVYYPNKKNAILIVDPKENQ